MTDVVFALAGLVFIAGLLPSFRRGRRPSAVTSLAYALTLLVVAGAHILIGNTLAAVSCGINSAMWATLVYLKISED